MKSLNLALAFASLAIFVCTPHAAAQTSTVTTQPVRVVNTTKNPVPTVAQGTTTISGNVNVTNASLPVNGNVNVTNNPLPISGSVEVTNSSLPVTGTVDVSNLPLDANGNVRTSVAPDTTQYQFLSIAAYQVPSGGACVNSYGPDFCTYNGSQYVPIEQTLSTLSGQGYELVSVVSAGNFQGVQGENQMLYTLKLPLTGPHNRTSPFAGQR